MRAFELTDQYVLDRVAERAEGVFAYVPECALWQRYCDEDWTPELAGPALDDLRVAVILALWEGARGGKSEQRAEHLLRERLSLRSGDWGRAQLAQRAELIVPFRAWNTGPVRWEGLPANAFTSKRARRNPDDFWSSADLDRMLEITFGEQADSARIRLYSDVKQFVANSTIARHDPDSYARAQGTVPPESPPEIANGEGAPLPNSLLLFRRGTVCPCLSAWYPVLRRFFGSYVARVPQSVWGRWSRGVTPDWAFLLHGARFIFLEAPEKWERFPGMSLSRLVMGEEVWWHGRDGQRHPLAVRGCFFLEGSPVPDKGPGPLGSFDTGLLDRCLWTQTPH